MHIPDGFLDARTWIACSAISAVGLAIVTKKAQKSMEEKMVPMIALTSAFIFVAQMFNFPVAGGTSGHLLGALLTAVLIGPWAGALCMSLVLIVQCFVFQDGGLTTLGANILNMSFIGLFSGYLIFRLIQKGFGEKGFLLGCILGAWISVVAGAITCAVELGISGTVPMRAAIIAMGGIHSLIGIGEAAITFAVVSFVYKVRPELIATYKAPASLEEVTK